MERIPTHANLSIYLFVYELSVEVANPPEFNLQTTEPSSNLLMSSWTDPPLELLTQEFVMGSW